MRNPRTEAALTGQHRRARRLYWVALGLVGMLAVASYAMLDRMVRMQFGAAATMNVSGRQRMLVQQSALYASLLAAARDSTERDRLRMTLRLIADRIEHSHRELMSRPLSGDMTRIYSGVSGIDARVTRFLSELRELPTLAGRSSRRERLLSRRIVEQATGELLSRLDEAVSQVQRESEERIAGIQRLEALILALILILLVLEGVLIFRPLVAELVGAVERLDEQRERAARAAKLASLGQMAGAIAHEILNPMSLISMTTSHLRKCVSGGSRFEAEQLRNGLERIAKATSRVDRIITGLRHFASSSSEVEPFRETSLKAMIEETLEFCLPRFRRSGVELRVGAVPPELRLEMRSVQVSQVLVNLLNNAFDAVSQAPGKRWVAVEAREQEAYVAMRVSNSGEPIRPEVREKILAGGFSTKDSERGTGLGLSISRQIVESHHGSLSILENVPNTTFEILLPRKQPRAAAA